MAMQLDEMPPKSEPDMDEPLPETLTMGSGTDEFALKRTQGHRGPERIALSEVDLWMEQITVRDVCRDRLTAYMSTSREGEGGEGADIGLSGSIWERSDFSMRVNMLLNSRFAITAVRRLADFYVLLALFEDPTNNKLFPNHQGSVTLVADIFFWITSSCFAALLALQMMCIWPTRAKWGDIDQAINVMLFNKSWKQAEKGGTQFYPSEQWWILGSGIALLLCTVPHLTKYAIPADSDSLWHFQKETRYGTVDSGLFVAFRAFRIWFLLQYSMSTRYAFIALIHIIRKCVGIAVMLLLSFILHYYMFQGALAGVGADSDSVSDLNAYFTDNSDGLFNLYVAMTTANHPDIWMAMYSAHFFSMLILISFMVTTSIFLLNIFLAVVTNAYSSMIKEIVEMRYAKSEAVLNIVYESVVTRNDITASGLHAGPKNNSRARVQRQIDRSEGIKKSLFFELVHLVAETDEHKELWFALLDVSQDPTLTLTILTRTLILTRVIGWHHQSGGVRQALPDRKGPNHPQAPAPRQVSSNVPQAPQGCNVQQHLQPPLAVCSTLW
eukprot:TRINITY_DN4324_c0_g1_i3.p1 TRINITY_DN4324_c0_g1~~TRINITY_DN4324_c0_g1_i3.p1  ORF type:complete len:554 (-),score=130.15 TRINITY_DN4324_c0_g1_i3:2253-3914(-)